ncbi:hypothetical protein J2754_003012 [Halarchaeum solikamskense]|nr:hypothetical protein [Halarchaeum solikamskense]
MLDVTGLRWVRCFQANLFLEMPGNPVELGERLKFVVTSPVTVLPNVGERRALFHPAPLHEGGTLADDFGNRVVDFVHDGALIARIFETNWKRSKDTNFDIELVFKAGDEGFKPLDGGTAFRTGFDRDNKRASSVNGIVEMGSFSCRGVADEDIVVLRDVGFLEDAEELGVHPECFAHRFGLVLLALEVFGEVREHVVLGDNVDSFNGTNEVVELALWAANHVPDEVIDGLGALVVDAEEPREIAVLRVEGDDEWFQASAGVRDSEVCGSRGLTDTASLTVRRVR